MSFVRRIALAGLIANLIAPPVEADPASIPTLNPSVSISHLAPGTRVRTRIDATESSDFAVVWTETSGQDGDGSGVFMSRNANVEEPISVTTLGHQIDADVSMVPDGAAVVAWAQDAVEVRWRRFESGGGVGGTEETAFTGSAPGIDHFKDGRFVIAGVGPGFDVVAQRYDVDGVPDGPLFTASSAVPGSLVRVEVTIDDYIGIVWANPPGTIIQMRIIKPDGSPLGPDFTVGLSANPVDGLDIDHSSNGFHIIWGFPGLVQTRQVKTDGTFGAATQNVDVGIGPHGITALGTEALGMYDVGADLDSRCIDVNGFPFGPAITLDDAPMASMGSLDYDGTHLHVAFVVPSGVVRIRSSRSLLPVSVGDGAHAQVLPRAVPTVFRRGTRIEFNESDRVASTITVVDATGRVVRELFPECSGDRCAVQWDGTDDHRREAAPGVYFFRGAGVLGGKMVKLD